MPCTLVHANGGANLHRLPAEVHALAKALKRPVGSLTNKILNLEGFRANGARVETDSAGDLTARSATAAVQLFGPGTLADQLLVPAGVNGPAPTFLDYHRREIFRA